VRRQREAGLDICRIQRACDYMNFPIRGILADIIGKIILAL
jgi:hypothetical protein